MRPVKKEPPKYVDIKDLFSIKDTSEKEIVVKHKEYTEIINLIEYGEPILYKRKIYDFSGIVDVSDQTRFEINLEKLSMDDKRILLENVIRRVYDNNITDLDSKVIDYFKYNLLKKKGRQITIYDLESENIVGFALQNIEMFSKNIDQIRNQFEFFVFNKELNVFQNLKETNQVRFKQRKYLTIF